MAAAWTRFAGLAAGYGLFALLSGWLAEQPAMVALSPLGPGWLASGLIFGAALLTPVRQWPQVLGAGALGAFAWGWLRADLGLAGALAIAGTEVVAVLCGAAVTAAARPPSESTRAYAGLMSAGALVLGIAVSAVVSALMLSAVRSTLGWPGGFGPVARQIAAAVFTGLLVVVPILDTLGQFRVRRSGGLGMRRFLAGLIAAGLLILIMLVVFTPLGLRHLGPIVATFTYLPLPLLVLVVLLWGGVGSALAMLLCAVLASSCLYLGGGPFLVTENSPSEALLEVQGFVVVCALMVLTIRGLSQGYRRARERAQTWQLRYERALDAASVAIAEFDAVTGRALWCAQLDRVLGAESAQPDHIGDWHNQAEATDQARLRQAWQDVASGMRPGSRQPLRLRGRLRPAARLEQQLVPVRGPDGSVESVIVLLRAADGEE